MTEEYIRSRITALRLQKNVSEYKMSLDLGHSKGYIQSISSGRTMPSMAEFLAICDYFDISPKEFFDEDKSNPVKINEAVKYFNKLSDKDIELVTELLERLSKG